MTNSDQNFAYCPECGKQTVSYPRSRHWVCASCGFDLYNNVAAAVGVIITDEKNQVLFIKRAKDPRKGFLALPGGFVDPGESAEKAAARECKEETGLSVTSLTYLTSFPNTYEYKTVQYVTCDIFFTAQVIDTAHIRSALCAEDGEAADFSFCAVNSREKIESIPLAFMSAKKALTIFLEQKFC
jgi:ADP-ribose pyrophosphatase YjhB (NUDIX family)